MSGYTWVDGIAPEMQQEFFLLYSGEWWTADRKFDDVMSMVRHSDLVLGCCASDGKLIGFARVLTDYIFKAMIFDVIVHRDVRGHGLGKAIIDRIVGHETLQSVASFELYCPERLIPFYEKLGFAKGSATLLFRGH